MARVPDRPDVERPICSEDGCENDADFYLYDADSVGWRPICASHARRVHLSLEIHAWLESGYMKPIELGEPTGPPAEPSGGRAAAFREMVEETMGWSR